MGIFDRLRGVRPSRHYDRRERATMLPRWTRPPERNASEWLAMFGKNPRLAVVERIASDLSSASGKLLQVRPDGTETQLERHPFLRFWESPNPLHEFSAAALWRLAEIYLILKGEGFFVIERDILGRPAELWPVPVHWVTMTPYLGHPFYQIRTAAGTVMQVSVDDMFVMKDLNPLDPFMRGLGQMESAADEAETDEYAAKFQKRFFYNDATPNLIVSLPNSNEEQRRRFRAEWNERFKGVFNAHGLATIGEDISVQKVGENMKDLDMIQGRTFLRDAMLEHLGVPREIMGITENSNRATSEAAQFIYTQNVLMPKLRRREEAVNQQLVPLFGQGLVWKFDEIIPYSPEFDKARAMDGFNAGVLTKNEARELMRLPPAPHGDVYRTTYADLYIGTDEDPTEVTMSLANIQYVDGALPTDGHGVDVREEPDAAPDPDASGDAPAIEIKQAGPPASFDAAYREQRARFEVATTKFLKAQARRVGDALAGTSKAEGSVWDIIQLRGDGALDVEAFNALDGAAREQIASRFADSLADWANESNVLLGIFTPLWREAYDKGAYAAQVTYGIRGVNRPELISAAKLRGGMRVKGIQQTTRDAIARIVAGGIEHGDSRETLAKSIRQEMGTTAARARLIADQETITSLNAGQHDMMRKAGAMKKTWRHRPQKNPRDGAHGHANHVRLQNETAPIDGVFSNGLRFPRDPDGPPEETINCRCWLSYHFE